MSTVKTWTISLELARIVYDLCVCGEKIKGIRVLRLFLLQTILISLKEAKDLADEIARSNLVLMEHTSYKGKKYVRFEVKNTF